MPPRNEISVEPNKEQQLLVDEFTDFVMLISPSKWSPEARRAYEKLVRRLEKVS